MIFRFLWIPLAKTRVHSVCVGRKKILLLEHNIILSYWIGFNNESNPITAVLLRKGKLGHRDTHSKHYVKIETEILVMYIQTEEG